MIRTIHVARNLRILVSTVKQHVTEDPATMVLQTARRLPRAAREIAIRVAGGILRRDHSAAGALLRTIGGDTAEPPPRSRRPGGRASPPGEFRGSLRWRLPSGKSTSRDDFSRGVRLTTRTW